MKTASEIRVHAWEPHVPFGWSKMSVINPKVCYSVNKQLSLPSTLVQPHCFWVVFERCPNRSSAGDTTNLTEGSHDFPCSLERKAFHIIPRWSDVVCSRKIRNPEILRQKYPEATPESSSRVPWSCHWKRVAAVGSRYCEVNETEVAWITENADYTDCDNGNIFCIDFKLGTLNYIFKSRSKT